jgi:membrane fusion protein, multidrug efflux system
MEFERAKGLLETNAVARQEFDSRQIAVDTGLAQIRANEAAVNQARAELEQSKAAVSQAQAAIEVAKARLATSDAMIATAELNVEYTSIVSPINARAGQRHVDIGNIVTANSTGTPLVVLQTLDPIYAEFVVPESELSRIQASLSAKTLSAEAWAPETPDAKKKGEVTFLDNNVQGQTGTIRLRATVQNAERAFWPGQFVNVRLILGTHKSANLIPNVAVQVGQKGLFIYVVKDDSTVEQRPVKVGQRHGTDVSILDGLKPGETVVTDGHLALQPGAKVQVQQQAVTPEQQAAEKKSNAASEGDGAK